MTDSGSNHSGGDETSRWDLTADALRFRVSQLMLVQDVRFFHQFSVRKQRTWSEDLLFSIWEVLSISNLNMLNIQRCIQVYEHWALLEEDWHGDSAIVRKLSNAMGSHEMKEGFSKLGSFADFQKLLSPGKTVKRRGKEGFWETVFFCANCGKPHPNSRTLWCSIWGFQLAEEKERP